MTKIADVKVGDVLVADGGFTCLHEGQACEVVVMADGGLAVRCKGPDGDGAAESNLHDLAGQTDHEGNLVGLHKARCPSTCSL